MTDHAADSPMTPDNTRSKGRGAYLPVLPEGWRYAVNLNGPDGNINVRPERDAPERFVVEVSHNRLDGRTLRRDSLADALRAATKSVKTLARLSKHEAEAQAARQSLLDQIEAGDTEDDGGEPTADSPRSTAPSDTGPDN